ncbi:MAG: DUF6114 domain-containing protein [Haloarculaceae archaeon]
MSVKTTLWDAIPGPITRRIDGRITRFNDWREVRPFWGGVLLMLAGAIIGWFPLQFTTELAFIGGISTVIGLVFAVLVFLSGAFVLARPDMSTIFGVIGIAMSILSLIGALGGMFVGMFIGIAGGNLCVAWQPPAGERESESDVPADEVQFSWQGDQ